MLFFPRNTIGSKNSVFSFRRSITNSIMSNLSTQGLALAGFLPFLSSVLYCMLGTAALVSVASSLLATFPTFWFRIVISFVVFRVVVFDRAIPLVRLDPKNINVESPKDLKDLTEKPRTTT